jgi:hypothetical protein
MCVLILPLSFGFTVLLDKSLKLLAGLRFRSKFGLIGVTSGLSCVIAFGLVEQVGGRFNYDFLSDRDRIQKNLALLPQQIKSSGCSSFYLAPTNPIYTGDFVYIYQVDAMVISEFLGLPTLNGYSGQFPPAWRIWKLDQSDYESNVANWIIGAGLSRSSVCRFAYGS